MQHYIKKCIKNSWRIKNVLNVIFIQKCSKNYKNEKKILFVLLNDRHPLNYEFIDKLWPHPPPMLHDGECTFGDVL